MLSIKMATNYSSHPPSCTLYQFPCDVESLLSMACILPLFEAIQSLIEFGQSRDVALYDFVATMKQCKIVLGLLYLSSETCYSGDEFSVFSRLATVTS